MPRVRSVDKQNAILAAATRLVATEGLQASTAAIAKEAGVSNGALFVYFDTKVALLNELYLQLKTEMGQAAVEGRPTDKGIREQFWHMWCGWMEWAVAFPEKRRTLAQLDASKEITEATHHLTSNALSGMAELMQQARAGGPVADEPLAFVLQLVTALAESTIDAAIREPASADSYRRAGFEAMWRVLASKE